MPARARPYTSSNIKGKASSWIRMALSAGARRICCSMGKFNGENASVSDEGKKKPECGLATGSGLHCVLYLSAQALTPGAAAAASSRAFLVLPAREGMWHRPHT